MPITAKLSRRFYERVGDEAANDLVEWMNAVDATYRGELRDLNELNFARFDAKLEQRLAEFEAKVEKRFAEFEVRIERRFGELQSTLLRWMFAFWTGSMLTLAGFLWVMLNAIQHAR